ncbi:GGDEF domain-containing protein [Cryobacterium sp. 1639]|uniref:GGDEF domain-containing protein n=1 Tax=Cryobacterium inferilacus TaxID=2866629 RepID=UPI001C736276|nr:GGDEF domain-containing protein [Cryobacterium sp. 1639]MBX0301278.1 GGDEF domain-containing protein [Cryobacterium sp. 1639]
MTVKSATTYADFRTLALGVLALLAGLRSLLVLVIPLDPAPLNWIMLVSAAALLALFAVTVLRRQISEPAGLAGLWLALGGAVVGGVGFAPDQLGDVSCFTIVSLVVVAVAVLKVAAAVTTTVVGLVAGAACLGLRSEAPVQTAVVFVGMVITTSVVVGMLRSFLATERDHALGLALTDALTGTVNRRGMVDRVPALSDLADRTGQQLGCLVLDIDCFKAINDRYGHPYGDRVLVEVATAIGAVSRRSDVLVRLGGEEFALFVVVPGADELRMLAEQVRVAVAHQVAPPHPPVTVSVGGSLGSGGTDEAVAELVAAADAAMYQAKQAGRDRVVIPA